MTQKISIITPSFNQVDFVQKCLGSVSAQSEPPFEHLIYDGGSTDGTVDILRAYERQHDWVTLHVGKDNGQTDAINQGFTAAKGDIITWLNTDDFYLDDHVLKDTAEAFARHPEADFIYGRGDFIAPEGNFLREAYINEADDDLINHFMWSVGVLQPANFFTKSVFDRLGPLDESIGLAFDYEYWVRAAHYGMNFQFVDRKICAAVLHSDSKTMGQRGDSLKQAASVGQRHYGFVAYQWADRLAKFEIEKADGILEMGNTESAELTAARKKIFMDANATSGGLDQIFSHAHRKGAEPSVRYAKEQAGIDTKTAFITSFDGNFFDIGLTLIGGLQKNRPDSPIFIYDLGLTDAHKRLLAKIDNLFVLEFQNDIADFHETYFQPSSYGFKAYGLWHCRHYLNKNDNAIWIDSGIYALDDMSKCFDLIEKKHIFMVDHSDKGMWPFHNLTFCTDECAREMKASGKELAAPHMRAGILGYKIGGKFDKMFVDGFEYSLNEMALVGPKHPDKKDSKPRRISNEKIENAIKENKPYSPEALEELRYIFGYLGHRHDQTIFSILAARYDAPCQSANDYCIADDLSSAVSKRNWQQGRIHEAVMLPPDEVPEFYKQSAACTMQHRGTFSNSLGINYKDVDPKQTAIILGNGPSLKGFDFKNFEGKAVFGMNAAYRYWDTINWYPDYYSCLDLVVGVSHKDEIKRLIENSHEYGIKAFLLRDNLIQQLGDVKNFDRIMNFDEIKAHSHLFAAPTISTGSHTAGWAAMLGYEKLFLMGVDCNYVELVDGAVKGEGTELIIKEEKENPNYFFKGYQQKGDIYNVPNPGRDIHLQSWREIKEAVDFTDATIISANLESKVDAFDFCKFEDIQPDGTAQTIDRRVVLGIPEEETAPTELKQIRYPREAQAGFDETYLIYKMCEKNEPGVMIDVGAHFGGSARPFAMKGWSIFCQEPDPQNRKKLLANLGNSRHVKIDPRAVGEAPETGRVFYSSDESTGISGMLAFRDTHKQSATVDVTTVKDIIADNDIKHVDFLKIDVEGYDFGVLKGVPWDEMKPDMIECEFEDAKTKHLGHTWQDICDYLTERDYVVYVSEWHPIVRYGISHDWFALKKYPCELDDVDGWGNLLAFKTDPGEEALCDMLGEVMRLRNEDYVPAAVAAEPAVQSKPVAPPVTAEVKPLIPAKKQARSTRAPITKPVAPPVTTSALKTSAAPVPERFADKLRRKSPVLFRIAQVGKWGVNFAKRHIFVAILATLLLAGLIFAPVFVGTLKPFATYFWLAAAGFLFLAGAVLGLAFANMMANRIAVRENLARQTLKNEILMSVDRQHKQKSSDLMEAYDQIKVLRQDISAASEQNNSDQKQAQDDLKALVMGRLDLTVTDLEKLKQDSQRKIETSLEAQQQLESRLADRVTATERQIDIARRQLRTQLSMAIEGEAERSAESNLELQEQLEARLAEHLGTTSSELEGAKKQLETARKQLEKEADSRTSALAKAEKEARRNNAKITLAQEKLEERLTNRLTSTEKQLQSTQKQLEKEAKARAALASKIETDAKRRQTSLSKAQEKLEAKLADRLKAAEGQLAATRKKMDKDSKSRTSLAAKLEKENKQNIASISKAQDKLESRLAAQLKETESKLDATRKQLEKETKARASLSLGIEKESKRNSTSFSQAQEQLEVRLANRLKATEALLEKTQKQLEAETKARAELSAKTAEIADLSERAMKKAEEETKVDGTAFAEAQTELEARLAGRLKAAEEQLAAAQQKLEAEAQARTALSSEMAETASRSNASIARIEKSATEGVAGSQKAQELLEARFYERLKDTEDQLLRAEKDLANTLRRLEDIKQTSSAEKQSLEAEITNAKKQISSLEATVVATDKTVKEIGSNTPMQHQFFNRSLSTDHIKTFKDDWLKPLNLTETDRSLIYMSDRIANIEKNLKGRLATSIENAVLRTLVAKSVNGKKVNVLEIGVLFGISLAMIYDRTADIFEDVHVTALDPFEGYYGDNALDILTQERITRKVFVENMEAARVPAKNYTLIEGYSADDDVIISASKRSYDVLIIDGDHSYAGVKSDFVNYAPMVKRGGYILIDDDSAPEWPEITQYVDEELIPRDDLTLVGRSWRTAVFKVIKKVKA